MARRETGRQAPSRKGRVQQAWLAQARNGDQSARYQRPRRSKGFSGPALIYTLCLGLLLGWYGPGWVERIDEAGVHVPTLRLPGDIHLPGTRSTQARSADLLSADFGFCHRGGGTNCVVDGDTPETHGPRCAAEGELGAQATRRLQALMNAGPFSLESGDRDTDRYGRALRVVTREGESIGGMMVAEGLARSWDGSRHPWC
ncbi:thermonuclease family protein [Sphingobium sp. V4]|uniref:thermonuclease family protein n=1 Tax=Sphingobium sp. V4 TaxID=3038927 RepID=UPI0025581B0E|nr:thermonuclease family protein [Sphingobium sp. V4]WIW88472.1 thermonuclease family protein [Sphingobium sp. V4]